MRLLSRRKLGTADQFNQRGDRAEDVGAHIRMRFVLVRSPCFAVPTNLAMHSCYLADLLMRHWLISCATALQRSQGPDGGTFGADESCPLTIRMRRADYLLGGPLDQYGTDSTRRYDGLYMASTQPVPRSRGLHLFVARGLVHLRPPPPSTTGLLQYQSM